MFGGSAWYQPERDGTLEEYLKTYDGHSCMPLFKGYEHYQMLWDSGRLKPHFSSIRLMWNICREDEHFIVLGEHQIEGCTELRAHAGRPGIHDPRELLSADDCPPWKEQNLNPNPTPRK